MITVSVNASGKYDVKIGRGLLEILGAEARNLGNANKIFLVSDSNVWPLYGQIAAESLNNAGFTVCEFIFPAGEESKNSATYLNLLDQLATHQITRSDLIVALGGGVVGDLAGFAAATYLRGIRYIQVPTTLLAAVDSSVGGKTAIDLPAGKNLAGAFWQPSLVICDTDTLKTLPLEHLQDGFAEVIKYGILYDHPFFRYLETCAPGYYDAEKIISRCVELKRDAVMADEYDNGARRMLNLGHTIGHAIESCSNYKISHGKAVAMGMATVARAVKCRDASRIIHLLQRFGLPVSTEFNPQELCRHALADKKRRGNNLCLIVPRGIGDCGIVSLPVEQLETFIEAGF